MLGVDRELVAAPTGEGPRETTAAHPACVYPRKAKRVIQLFMAGAASHVDLFDFKPALVKHHGEPSDFGEHVEAFQNGLGPWLKPVWEFKPYGNCGKMLSEVVAARQGRRRDGVRAQCGRQVGRALARHLPADHRVSAPRLPGDGVLGELRLGIDER